MLDHQSGAVAHAQVPLELQGRDVGLGLGQQLHRQEPARQQQLTELEGCATEDAALVLAASALPVTLAAPREARPGLADAAARALEAPGPAQSDQRRLACSSVPYKLKNSRIDRPGRNCTRFIGMAHLLGGCRHRQAPVAHCVSLLNFVAV